MIETRSGNPPLCRRRVVLIGAAGCGKSSVGRAAAARLGIPFVEGDDLHPESNILKMQRGEPLTDEDRWPWLDRVGAEIARYAAQDRYAVIACSALRRRYRDRLRAADPGLLFVLLDAPRPLLESRLRTRQGHFMPATLVSSQCATLERPNPDENAFVLDATLPIGQLVTAVVALLAGACADT